jgi:hypothetical protein
MRWRICQCIWPVRRDSIAAATLCPPARTRHNIAAPLVWCKLVYAMQPEYAYIHKCHFVDLKLNHLQDCDKYLTSLQDCDNRYCDACEHDFFLPCATKQPKWIVFLPCATKEPKWIELCLLYPVPQKSPNSLDKRTNTTLHWTNTTLFFPVGNPLVTSA